MNSLTKIIAAFALATLLGALAIGQAQSRRGDGNPPPNGPGRAGQRPPGPPDGLNPRMLDQLNLTDLQREQIETLHDTARAEGQKFGKQLRANHDQVEALITGGAFDEAQARKLLAT
ncbi:MAG: periplasmic heavy metal sensor, partial [Pyrinomonadaceae bacterium]